MFLSYYHAKYALFIIEYYKLQENRFKAINWYLFILHNKLDSSFYRYILKANFVGMVTLNAGLAKKILTLFPINLKLLKALTDSRASNSAIQLRTCFIHYLLSFLIDDNVILISELLKMKGIN